MKVSPLIGSMGYRILVQKERQKERQEDRREGRREDRREDRNDGQSSHQESSQSQQHSDHSQGHSSGHSPGFLPGRSPDHSPGLSEEDQEFHLYGDGVNPHSQENLLSKAIDLFHADGQTQANGLTACTKGTCPDLKVVLKDRGGAAIREFTASEFIQLRGSSFKDGGTRGKLLDRKL